MPRRRFFLPLKALLQLLLALALIIPAAGRADDDADFAARQADAKKAFKEAVAPFVKNYCISCHGNRKTKGDLNLEPALKTPGDSASRPKWASALANVSAHDMPPDDVDKQPTDAERQRFQDAIAKIKFLSVKDPGPFVIRRLTKVEYGNTLHDLFGLDPAIAKELPDEVFGEGYLNSLSPMQTEQYLAIASDVLARIKDTPTEKRLFGETPAPNTDPHAAAKQTAGALARSAYRRPPTEAEIATLLSVYDLARANKLDHQAALRFVLKAILISPQFLFITPALASIPDQAQPIAPLDDHQLAQRLSYLLWATMPDRELAALADAGKLHDPLILKAQTKRLLADPRSRALFDGFGSQWLDLATLKAKTFDPAKFPQMTPALRAAMYDEARLFFESIVRENRSVLTFIDADYTFLNATLAPLYGLEKTVTGPAMRRVQLADRNRGGILGQPGVLATTSFPNRTSAVKRGVWVLEQVLGQHVPPAPPNVPSLEKQDKTKIATLTLRQRTELHRANAVCNNCHKILDPIGFGLENFDAIGRWRDHDDTGGPIDAAGELPGGQHFSKPSELKAIILATRKTDLARNLLRQLMAYALCRQLEGYDEIVVDQLMNTLQADNYLMQDLLTGIVTSYPFLNRRVTDTIASVTP